MKFGYINLGSKQNSLHNIQSLSERGYWLHFVHDFAEGDDVKGFLTECNGCDVVFVSGSRKRFLNGFSIDDDFLFSTHLQEETLLYIFLDNLDGFSSIEGIIKDYYAKLNIRMSVYRIFVEQGRAIDFESLYASHKHKYADKYLLTVQKNGCFLDIIVRCRKDCRITPLNRLILDNYFNYIYATSFISLGELIATRLCKKSLRVRVAESFTAGRIAVELTRMNGASGFFVESIVSYSDESKTERLRVSQEYLNEHGAISKEVVHGMLRSLVRSGCDIAIATSGNAGPTAQKGGKVGKCFIGTVAHGKQGKIEVNEYDFCGSREEITQFGVAHTLFLLYRKLMIAYN